MSGYEDFEIAEMRKRVPKLSELELRREVGKLQAAMRDAKTVSPFSKEVRLYLGELGAELERRHVPDDLATRSRLEYEDMPASVFKQKVDANAAALATHKANPAAGTAEQYGKLESERMALSLEITRRAVVAGG